MRRKPRICQEAGRDRGQRTEKTGAGRESGAGARCPDRGLQPQYRDTIVSKGLEIGGAAGRGADLKELRRLGLDVNLAPVLDVLAEAYSRNIGIRSYGKDWRLVAQLGAARISGMQQG